MFGHENMWWRKLKKSSQYYVTSDFFECLWAIADQAMVGVCPILQLCLSSLSATNTQWPFLTIYAKSQMWQFVCISSSMEPIIWWGLTWYLDQNDFANLFTCPLVWPIEQNTQSKANSHGWWRPGLQRQFQKAIGFGKLISWRVLQGDISWWKWKGRVGGDIRKLITSAK